MLLESHCYTTAGSLESFLIACFSSGEAKIPERIPISKGYEREKTYTDGQRQFHSFFFIPENNSLNRVFFFLDRVILACEMAISSIKRSLG